MTSPFFADDIAVPDELTHVQFAPVSVTVPSLSVEHAVVMFPPTDHL